MIEAGARAGRVPEELPIPCESGALASARSAGMRVEHLEGLIEAIAFVLDGLMPVTRQCHEEIVEHRTQAPAIWTLLAPQCRISVHET